MEKTATTYLQEKVLQLIATKADQWRVQQASNGIDSLMYRDPTGLFEVWVARIFPPEAHVYAADTRAVVPLPIGASDECYKAALYVLQQKKAEKQARDNEVVAKALCGI